MNPGDGNAQAFVAELFDRAPKRRGVVVLAWILAVGGHAAAATLAAGARPHATEAAAPVEVEFLAPEPEPPPEPPAPVPVTPGPPEPEPEPVAPNTPLVPAPSVPAAAAAGALLTAKDDPLEPDQKDELIDFASDPNSRVYGGGVVAVGRVQTVGQRGARVGGRARTPMNSRPSGNSRGPKHRRPGASDLSRRPHLTEADPCRGFFPPSAIDNSALAAVMVVVDAAGRAATATVLSESPARQGFGRAARACMLSKHFVPALDRTGNGIEAAVRVNVRFRR